MVPGVHSRGQSQHQFVFPPLLVNQLLVEEEKQWKALIHFENEGHDLKGAKRSLYMVHFILVGVLI